ncbi:hypothetical protein ACEUZ9_002851 [Paracoccus litorisediminis]|uniref:hypothetical protein n=1 Tax=Paracoccus litorisediminis TaxID=2006130 RepID=UPI0037313213
MSRTGAVSSEAAAMADGKSARASSWTDEETRKLIHMWSTSTNAEIARALGRNENAIAIKGSRLKLPRKDVAAKMMSSAKKGAKLRDCLTCRRPFHSEGAHNRICDPCKEGHSQYDTDYIVQMGGFY